jgi:hypothetical protein
MKLNVELNKTYDYFDDGKITIGRKIPVTITEIIPFNEIDKETLSNWKEEVKQCYWLYAKETDYFIMGELKLSNNEIEKVIFVRTININNNNGWFSLGWWAGRLDVDGTLADSLK